MDWNNPDGNSTVAIAITTLPAEVPAHDPRHGGTILVNPGGPGGSGIGLVLGEGRLLQRALDGDKSYEIMGFDPRGIRFTTPKVDCFDNDAFARDAWLLERHGLGWVDASDDALRRHLGLYKAYGSLCEKTLGDSGILKHVTTAAVCRDMVEIVDRIDDLRKKDLALRSADGQAQHPLVDKQEPGQPDVARLQFFGFSYGTVLGNTFASMYPGRVGRIVIDGVVDINDYTSGLWNQNLLDTESIVKYFYDTCFDEGDGCPIRITTDRSGADIKARIDKLITDADMSPPSFVHGNNIRAVTGNDIRNAFKYTLYAPIALFPRHAQLLADALMGNYTLVFQDPDIPQLREACRSDYTENLPLERDASLAIACSDADDEITHDFAFHTKNINFLKNQSITIGAKWAENTMRCHALQSRPEWRFQGPWTTPPADPNLKSGVPAAPLLLLSSRLDPVTPLVNANLMSASHPGSAVVIQDSVGHCAFGSAWSECTNQILRDYFQHGIVPQNGTVCGSTCRPWHTEGCGLESQEASVLATPGEYKGFSYRFPLGV
ncbi:hypothetical protein GQ53DRAFT_746656 [Thozetella sp. PMI_491]|nr:hypothetical protein GQ53DRAFT_746656 [Thozetella sp. PMI_491]